MTTNTLDTLLDAVRQERQRQDDRWGQQNHTYIGGGPQLAGSFLSTYRRQLAIAREVDFLRNQNGTLGWDGILLEEVYEALTAQNLEDAREELIQVAAVALAAIESLERNLPKESDGNAV